MHSFLGCRDCMCPVVLTRGSDQSPVSTKFEMRDDDNVIRNYGRMLIELAAAIPDGLVCFFVSYSYMDKIVSKWHDMGVLTVGCLSLLRNNNVCAACRVAAWHCASCISYAQEPNDLLLPGSASGRHDESQVMLVSNISES